MFPKTILENILGRMMLIFIIIKIENNSHFFAMIEGSEKIKTMFGSWKILKKEKEKIY